MNSTEDNNKKDCLSCFSCIFLLAGMITLIIDFTQIAAYNDLENQISHIYNYSSCYQVCGYQYYYERYGQCCQHYDYTYCTSKDGCISLFVLSLKSKQENTFSSITALSIISGFLFLSVIVFVCKICKKTNHPNQAPLLVRQPHFNINQSEQGSQRSIDVRYDSFAYVDQENACSICLEYFQNEKAILLKCGHIFHSECIRDWAAKQENCPVCRSSQ